MKMTQLIGQTRKEVPAGVSARSHELLLRGAYMHQVAAGIFSYLPLGLRVMHKINEILRQEMQNIGAQEVSMPVVQPAELWQQSGRWDKIGAEMGRLVDRKGHDMALAMTHEEATADLVRQYIHSYRDLPRLIYHLQTKWRDDPRPRAGLIRVREFIMKDSYSLDSTWQGLEQQYRNHYQAYFRIYDRCKLPTIAVLSDTGMMGGSIAHEFMYASEVGEDSILFCTTCDYRANRQVAEFRKPQLETNKANQKLQPLQEIATPNCKTIEQVSAHLKTPAEHCAKMVFFAANFASPTQENEAQTNKLIAAILPGDMELNETKLSTLIGAKELRPAEETEIRATGAVPGYASPHKLKNCLIVADDLITNGTNWLSGANREGYHAQGLNSGRDFTPDHTGDLCAAAPGHPCKNCGEALQLVKAIEVGNIFQLGSFYSEAMGCYFTDESGKEKPVLMGSYGIGVGRLMACIAEEHNDTNGLIWPISVAPYQVHLISLGEDETANQVYQALEQAGIEVLFDERPERPGFKFKDADLIGIPIRLTVGKRSLESGGLELQLRGTTAEKTYWPVSEATERTLKQIKDLHKEIQVRQIEYPEPQT